MRNLAGVEDCDKFIERELIRSRIPIAKMPCRANGEVPYSIYGESEGFKFTRAWSYWVVRGKVPVSVAKILYADPVGKEDIRVSGHCGCPPPEPPWAEYYDKSTGTKLITKKEFSEMEKIDRLKKFLPDYFPVDDLTVGDGFVELYHIDSEVGLRVFVDTLHRLGILQRQFGTADPSADLEKSETCEES